MSKAFDFIDKQVSAHTRTQTRAVKHSWSKRASKRILDILGSFLFLFFFWPVFVVIGLIIKRDSSGPVYYHGLRMGRNGKPFTIHKFRTMYETPESYAGSPLTGENDDRVTPFGAWLRETKFNELPQFWNVLVGEMSIVGPRPEFPDIVEQWPQDVCDEVLSVRPGITSPASVTFRNEEKMLKGQSILDDYLSTILPEKLRMDQLYVRNHSFIGDLDVVFMTLVLLLPGLRGRNIKEANLYEGYLARFFDKVVSWFFIDVIVAFIAISFAALIWRFQAPLEIGFLRMLLIAIFLAASLAIFNSLFGLKNIEWRYASPVHVLDLAISTSVATLFFILVGYLLKIPILPLPLMVNFGFFCFFGFVVSRYRERLITGLASRWIRWRSQATMIGERLLVVGAGDCGQLAIWLLEKSQLSTAFSIVGMVDDDFGKVGQRINGYKVLGTTLEIPQIVEKKNIGLIVFAINNLNKKEQQRILTICKNLSLRIIMIPDLLKVVSEYFLKEVREVAPSNE